MKLLAPVDFEQGPPLADALVSGKEIGLRPDRMYPKTYSLTVHFAPGETDPLSAVQTAVAAHASENLPGNFVVVQQSAAIVVKPASGALSDLPITIPQAERTPDETAQVIAQALAAASGKRVKFLAQPYSNQKPIPFTAANQPLSGILAKWSDFFGPTSFLLIYDPLSNSYCLSFVTVPNAPIVVQNSPALSSRRPTDSSFFTKQK